MWNKDKSVKLTHFMVRAFYVILAAASVCAPSLVKVQVFDAVDSSFLVPFYLAVPAGLAALICLDKLLINIKKEIVFNIKNVKLLRILSWCCVYAAAVSIVFFAVMCVIYKDDIFYSFVAISIAEAFVGVIVRVIKNVFESAIIIKEENELTI